MAQDVKTMTPDMSVMGASSFTLITPSATAFTTNTRAVYVDTSGTATWIDEDGNTSTNVNVVAGSTIPVRLQKVTAVSSAVLYAMR